jgi:hypothetical protein
MMHYLERRVHIESGKTKMHCMRMMEMKKEHGIG